MYVRVGDYMANAEDQKGKLLYILKILWEETDEAHPMSAQQIADRVENYGIHCERKSIYPCLDSLSDFGFDIIRGRKGAYMGSRLFELPELKLLVDAVQSSRFITDKKASSLIQKLSSLTNVHERKNLRGQVYVRNRIRTMNESIYYNIDAISEGIGKNVQIHFKYMSWDSEKNMVPKRGGADYKVSPWCLIWEREKYYLVAYEKETDKIKHFRVDKMKQIKLADDEREGKNEFDRLDMTTYTTENFGMFQGEKETVTLSVDKELAGVIIDRFGTDVWMHEADKDRLTVVVEVAVSPQFFGWVTAFAGRVRIVKPEYVLDEYRRMLEACM